MDLYLVNDSKIHPVVVDVHGGGWSGGSKSDQWTLAEYPLLNALGVDLVSVNYRLSENYKWPSPFQDVACAIRFLRANANLYSINASEIGIFGQSAGGQISSMIALTDGGVGLVGYEADSFYENYSSSVQAEIAWFGPTNLTIRSDFSSDANQNIKQEFGTSFQNLSVASPVYYVSNSDVPIALWHGLNDTTVNYHQSVYLISFLQAHGNTNDEITLVNEANHSWNHGSNWPPMNPSLSQIENETAMWLANNL